jgi:hypothetical protein
MTKLIPQDCVLIAKYAPDRVANLVSMYNRVNQLAEIAGEFSSLPQVAECLGRVRLIHGQLTRKRFRVGLMGPFQMGKSTAFNSVIGAEDPSDQPSSEGAGSATTAVITRLFPEPLPNPPSDTKRKIYARYLSQSQVEEKLQYLRRMTNLSKVEGDLLAAARSKYEAITVQNQHEPIEGHPSGMKFVKEIDVKYLGLFLKSHSTYGGKASPNSQELSDSTTGLHDVNWEKRKEFLNHPPEFDKSFYTWNKLSVTVPPMLSSVDIYYPTDKLPEEIVFIDTPGLGSLGSVDEWLLVNHIPELDGAIVVPDAARVMDEITTPILLLLQKHFRKDFARRVWLVGGKADNISKEFASSTSSGLHNYRHLAEQYQLDLSHVSFTTKYPQSLRDRFPEIPPELNSSGLAGLQTAWKELIRDGGIERLRQIMRSDLASEIGKSLAESCERELRDLEAKLRGLIESSIEDAKSNENLQSKVTDFKLKLIGEIADIRFDVHEPDWFAVPTGELIEKLLSKIPVFREQVKYIPFSEAFLDHAKILQNELIKFCRERFNEAAYDEAKERCLHKLEDPHVPLVLPGRMPQGVLTAWEQFKDLDQLMSWRDEGFPSFELNSPFQPLASVDAHLFGRADQYINMLETKIRLVSWQVSYIYRARLSSRLCELLGFATEYIDHSNKQLDNALVQQIRERLTEVGN